MWGHSLPGKHSTRQPKRAILRTLPPALDVLASDEAQALPARRAAQVMHERQPLVCFWCSRACADQALVETIEGKRQLFHKKCWSGWVYQGRPKVRQLE